MSNCEEKTDQPATEREFTITVKLPKISLKIFICLLILCLGFALGFVLSELSYTARHQQIDGQIDDFRQHVYLFDTEQKIADHYKAMETRHSPECHFARQEMAQTGRDRPLVTVGPFTIFVNNDTSEVSVHESQSPMYLVRLRRTGQLKFLSLNGLLEKDQKGQSFPRFGAVITYSDDGVYKKGGVSLRDDNEKLTSFDDSKGIGVFDKMEVWENGEKSTYSLNGFTWEQEGEGPLMGMPPPVLPLPTQE